VTVFQQQMVDFHTPQYSKALLYYPKEKILKKSKPNYRNTPTLEQDSTQLQFSDMSQSSTQPSWPLRFCFEQPALKSHTTTEWSYDEETSVDPSLDILHELTLPS
jgi:hypothetical protein